MTTKANEARGADEFVLVPRKLTQSMLDAAEPAFAAINGHLATTQIRAGVALKLSDNDKSPLENAWDAMLAAAPSRAEEQPQPVAYLHEWIDPEFGELRAEASLSNIARSWEIAPKFTPLYAHPPQPDAVKVTDAWHTCEESSQCIPCDADEVSFNDSALATLERNINNLFIFALSGSDALGSLRHTVRAYFAEYEAAATPCANCGGSGWHTERDNNGAPIGDSPCDTCNPDGDTKREACSSPRPRSRPIPASTDRRRGQMNNDIVVQLRSMSGKVNQLIGAIRMSSIWKLLPAELRDMLTSDDPDILTRAADEIVRLRQTEGAESAKG